MVIKIYVSGISGNKEVKKRQQRVLMILESKNVVYEVIDITEPGKEAEKEFMQLNSNAKESKYPLPPQIFNDEDYCGDYEDFDEANEMDELEKFLKGASISSAEITENKSQSDVQQNGNASSREPSTDKDVVVPGEDGEDGTEERRPSETENDKLSDNIKRSGSETEIKDLSEDGVDLGKDDEDGGEDGEKKEENSEDQDNDE